MRRFNPERELRKIQRGNRNKIIFCVIALLLIISIGSTYALYQVRYSKRIIYTKVAPFSTHDLDLAVYVDGSKVSTMPAKGTAYYSNITCESDPNATASWDYSEWKINNFKALLPNKCNVYFVTAHKDSSGANPPELYQGLIPVTFDSSGNVIVADPSSNWYSYPDRKWANAVLIKNKGFAVDLSGNGNNADIVGGAEIGNEGLVLDGNDDGIYLADMVKDLFKQSNTIQIKLKREEIGRSITFGNYTTSPYINYEATNNTNTIYWNTTSGVTNGTFTSNEFVTVTYIFDKENSNIKVYTNELETATFTNGAYKTSNFDIKNAYIGRDNYQTGAGSASFQGIIEKVMIYNKALTLNEIKQNLSATSGKVGTGGVVADKLHLYYDFKVPQTVDTTPGEVLDMKVISQMYVWIPRYKYQLFNAENGTSNEQIINVKFESGTKSSGDAKCIIADTGKETCTNALNGKWFTHPAFSFGNNNDPSLNTQLTGFWIGKFASSYSDNEIKIIPGASSWRGINLYTQFTTVRNIDLSQSSRYNLDSREIDTHLIKNMEWGALAYLTFSTYGVYGAYGVGNWNGLTQNANSSYLTGYAGASDAWNSENGGNASTTGNMYGVYDGYSYLSPAVMAWAVNAGMASSGFGTLPENKYYDKYENTSDWGHFGTGHLGDATKEILKTLSGSRTRPNWFGASLAPPNGSTNPWLRRSGSLTGSYYSTGAGSGGESQNAISTFVILTAQDGDS